MTRLLPEPRGVPKPVINQINATARRLAVVWRLPQLCRRVQIRFSSRLTRSLGNCRSANGAVVLSLRLLEPRYRQLLPEVVCHELAHIGVRMRHRRRARPHGPEWRALMEEARFPARRTIPGPGLVRDVRRRKRQTSVFEHRCPVCQMIRKARRRVPQWRCAECVRAGLDGLLQITRVSSRGEPQHV